MADIDIPNATEHSRKIRTDAVNEVGMLPIRALSMIAYLVSNPSPKIQSQLAAITSAPGRRSACGEVANSNVVLDDCKDVTGLSEATR